MIPEHSVIMQGRQVVSILEGRKDLTRRPVKAAIGRNVDRWSRVQAGHRLWVKETWQTKTMASGTDEGHVGIRFKADDAWIGIENSEGAADRWLVAHQNGRFGADWRPSMFIPRWACRIVLEVVSIRQEPLWLVMEGGEHGEFAREGIPSMHAFRDGWNRMHNGPHAWDANPLVWRIEFRRAS